METMLFRQSNRKVVCVKILIIDNLTETFVGTEVKSGLQRSSKLDARAFAKLGYDTTYIFCGQIDYTYPYKKISVETPLKKTRGLDIRQSIVIVPILRAGLGLVEGFVKFLPNVEKGHIGLYRNEQTYQPVEYLCKLPRVENKHIFILDPMLATGNSSSAAIDLVKKKGVKISNIKFKTKN